MENTTTISNGQTAIQEEQPRQEPKQKKNTRSYKSEFQRLEAKYQRLQIVAWSLAGGLILAIAFILTNGVG